jgi:hypothetical protein
LQIFPQQVGHVAGQGLGLQLAALVPASGKGNGWRIGRQVEGFRRKTGQSGRAETRAAGRGVRDEPITACQSAETPLAGPGDLQQAAQFVGVQSAPDVAPVNVRVAGLQVYGAGLNVALSDRLSFGLNQGGYAAADFNGNEPGLFRDRLGVLRDRRGFAGQRDGWLNLGGFLQYTLIQDVPNQFLLTAGLRLEVPSGSAAIFQGYGPVHLAPYLTFGKEFGKFHVLGTGGYQFPTASGDATTYLFYANFHLDRRRSAGSTR